jgi:DNA-binding NtrC family response regulator
MPLSSVSVIEQRPTAFYQAEEVASDGRVIARSAAMCEILDLTRKVAGANVPVLIIGELGAGKQTIAREIHRQSPRATRPFVHVVCGALRESDLDEKLFGSSLDFSGRDTSPPTSLLESSQGSTLFLDGVAQLPLWAQAKLLDALQCRSGRIHRDGDTVPSQSLVIASDTCDLETAVAENRFCSGLYYYLNAGRIDIPPLRHRQEDILVLAEHFLAAAVFMLCRPHMQLPWCFSPEARQSLLQYDWPGNVLQLAAVVARAAMLAEGPEIGQACLTGLLCRACQAADSETISVPLAGGLKNIEIALVNEVVSRCRGNKAAAARVLKLHRRTLYRLLGK